MKIENFDTGLKGQQDIKNIIISPEENYNNKKRVREYLKNIVHQGYRYLSLFLILKEENKL
jgi:hypothetical protein